MVESEQHIMTGINKELIEANGFRVSNNGSVLTQNGQRVKNAVAEQIAAGVIIGNFDIDELKRRKNAKAANKGVTVNMVDELEKISPAIGLLEVGQTAQLAIPALPSGSEKDPVRSFVMQIVTKLNQLTSAGREWAGRQFDTLSSDDGSVVYVSRRLDGEAKVRNPGGGGKSRKPKVATPATAETNTQVLGEPNKEQAIVQDHKTPENA